MTREALFDEFVRVGAVLTNGHFLLSSGLHSDTYFDCQKITLRSEQLRGDVGQALVEAIDRPVCVVGLKTLGNDLADWAAEALKRKSGSRFVPVVKTDSPQKYCFVPDEILDALSYIADRDVWLIDDVLTTGVNLRGAMKMVKEYSGKMVGASVVCTHGNVTAQDLGLPQLDYLVELPMEKYDPQDFCPLCDKGIPLRNMKQEAMATAS